MKLFVQLLDETRDFYRILGIREKPGFAPDSTLRLQLIHAQIIKTTLKNSKIDKRGLIDPLQFEAKSGGKLLKYLIEYLEEDPVHARWYWH